MKRELCLASLMIPLFACAALDDRSEHNQDPNAGPAVPVAFGNRGNSALARLSRIADDPALAGASVYDGRVFAPGAPRGSPLFEYERRVQTSPEAGSPVAAPPFACGVACELTSTHITRDPDGRTIIVEQASSDRDYSVHAYAIVNRQSGFSGIASISADGQRIDYRLERSGRTTTRSEPVSAPVVTGPTLFGFVLRHREALQRGEALKVQMLLLVEKRSYGFEIRRVESDPSTDSGLTDSGSTASFSLTPTHWFVRLFVSPMKLTVDQAGARIVQYEGRVPPKFVSDGRARDLDAVVDYRMEASAFQ